MSEKINDGGVAFPCPHESAPNEGMSLRDYFAAKALQGLLACPLVRAVTDATENPTKTIAKEAYDYADAMIAEREKK